MKRAIAVVVFLLMLIPVGCGGSGPEKVSVYGNVAVDGRPVVRGTIAFVSLQGGRTAAGPIIDGVYDISQNDGPYVGEQKVTIQVFEKTGKVIEVKKSLPGPPDEEAAIPEGGIRMEETKQILPARYNTASELRAMLESGQDSPVNFELTLSED